MTDQTTFVKTIVTLDLAYENDEIDYEQHVAGHSDVWAAVRAAGLVDEVRQALCVHARKDAPARRERVRARRRARAAA